MSDSDNTGYAPPAVWTWDKENGGNWAGINRPTAGARHEAELPKGRASAAALFAGDTQRAEGHDHA